MLGAREALPLPVLGLHGVILFAFTLLDKQEKTETALGLKWGCWLGSNPRNAARG